METVFTQSAIEQQHKQTQHGNCLQTVLQNSNTNRETVFTQSVRTATQTGKPSSHKVSQNSHTNRGTVFTVSQNSHTNRGTAFTQSAREQPHNLSPPVTKGFQSYFSSHPRNWYTLKAHKKCSHISHLAIIQRNPPTNLTSAGKNVTLPEKKKLHHQCAPQGYCCYSRDTGTTASPPCSLLPSRPRIPTL